MRLNEILNEGADEETYLANIKDGGSFNVKACSMSEARAKAKEKLQPGQRLDKVVKDYQGCLLYTSPSPRDKRQSRMPSSA